MRRHRDAGAVSAQPVDNGEEATVRVVSMQTPLQAPALPSVARSCSSGDPPLFESADGPARL
jgi:hypothetical protein